MPNTPTSIQLQLRLGSFPRHNTLNQPVWITLWGINLCILARVLQSFVPAHIDLKVMLVG